MLVDEINIRITAGQGGVGKCGPEKVFRSAQTGGDGGRGGNVYVSATSDLSALNRFVGIKEIKAGDGGRGGENNRTGKNGADVEILLPLGTAIIDTETNSVIKEMDKLEEQFLLCKGGLGSRGANFRPKPGLLGQSIKVKFSLKLIAKYGLIGLPNAGKSSLLNELTNAKAQIGAYPFTTLEPNLGVLNGQIIADIPGLIEGASVGRGLGIKFLKHIEKVSLLFHCIACDSRDVAKDYLSVTSELKKFGEHLVDKPEVIVLTKTDLVTNNVLKSHIRNLSKFKRQIITVSIKDPVSLENFKKSF